MAEVDFAIRCRGVGRDGETCRNVLGLSIDGLLVSQHKGRKLSGVLPTSQLAIVCEQCGYEWHPVLPFVAAHRRQDEGDDGAQP